MKILVIVLGFLILSGCSPSNKDWLKDRAEQKWAKQGYEVIDYQGFQWGLLGFGTPYGGASVWHRLKKSGGKAVSYSGYVKRWGDEIQVYGPEADKGESLLSHEGINLKIN